MTRTATYEVPVEARLVVVLGAEGEHGQHDATDEDLARFQLVDRRRAYREISARLREVLGDQERSEVRDDLTGTALNPFRYLAELTLTCPELDYDDALEALRRINAVLRGLPTLVSRVEQIEAKARQSGVPDEAYLSTQVIRETLGMPQEGR